MRTASECIERLQAIRRELARIAKYPTPTAAQARSFDVLAAEFDAVDAERLDAETREADAARDTMRGRIASGELRTERGAGGEGDSAFRPSAARDLNTLSVRSDETLAAWGIRTGRMPSATDDGSLSLGRMLRGVATGSWDGADAELRAVSENPSSAGGVLVPTPITAGVLDRARNVARVVQAGATVVPMTTASLRYPRLLTGLAPDWRNENAPINDKALTFDSVTLSAKSLACMVKISWELLEDAPPSSDVIEAEFAAAFALEWDRVAMRGSGVAPEPRGVRNTTGISVTAFGGADGAAPTSWNHLVDAIQTIRAGNFEPTGIMHSPRSETSLAKLREGGTTGPYLAAPSMLDTIPRYVTNQIPTNGTTGTSTDTSEIYIGDWRHLLLGVRTALRIRLLEERYADTGQFAFLADFRGDVQIAQPSAFNVITGVRP